MAFTLREKTKDVGGTAQAVRWVEKIFTMCLANARPPEMRGSPWLAGG